VLDACALCGACDPVCPEGIDLTGMIMDLRGELELPPEPDALQVAYGQAAAMAGPPHRGRRAAAARRRPARRCRTAGRVQALLGLGLAADDGADLAVALEIGGDIDPARRRRFLDASTAARWWSATACCWPPCAAGCPGAPAGPGRGAGQSAGAASPYRQRRLLCHRGARLPCRPRAPRRPLRRLRKESGCAMNLDLQRIACRRAPAAIPACAWAAAAEDLAQARWLLQGRQPARIVVEDPADRELLRA
jgi:ferredoxin